MKQCGFQSRFFNSIEIDSEKQTVTKTSRDEEKLRDEIRWYLKIPQALSQFTPKVMDYSLIPGNVFITLEYVNLPTLSELYLKNKLTKKEWQQVFQRLLSIAEMFKSYSGPLTETAAENMYVHKTRARLFDFIRSNKTAYLILKTGCFYLNGRKMPCPFSLLEGHLKQIYNLSTKMRIQLIHGDLCFSNILLDPTNLQGAKFIDPRGSFGDKTAIYGDLKYDMAKIRHSLNGYEHIMSQNFHLDVEGTEFYLNIPMTSLQDTLKKMWDKHLGDELGDIKIIESLLFLSMLPLHKEDPKRQLALYAVGAKLLTEAFDEIPGGSL